MSTIVENPQKAIAHRIIDDLFQKYESNEYMLSKINHYMENQLVAVFENIEKTHSDRLTRIQELSSEQDMFIQRFLNNNQYFYVSATERFFFYDGLHYQEYNEDDILYQVLSSISKERNLMSWKQRTKIHIMKRIKENSILNSVPESDTIQFVLDTLCPTIFSSRAEAKYFLTIIGDNILRKNSNLIHFISPKSKQFIQTINNICQMFTGGGCSQTFKYKYYEHSYPDCRMVKINESVKAEILWNPSVYNSALDIICVACHYSMRYTSSDQYLLEFGNDEVLLKSVFFIKDMQPSDLIQRFMDDYLDLNISDQANVVITWKNMQYLWKQYLESKNLPSIIFISKLKQFMTEKLRTYYREDIDSFVGISSKFLPAIQKFLGFWNDTMITDESETDFEIEEIIVLFRKWCQSKNENISHLNNKQIIDLISYYFPTIEIENEKYISKIRSTLWDKQMDIELSLYKLKDTVNSRQANDGNNVYSIYDAYLFYCREPHIQNVGKSYFEKYIFLNFPDYVIDAKFFTKEWFSL